MFAQTRADDPVGRLGGGEQKLQSFYGGERQRSAPGRQVPFTRESVTTFISLGSNSMSAAPVVKLETKNTEDI